MGFNPIKYTIQDILLDLTNTFDESNKNAFRQVQGEKIYYEIGNYKIKVKLNSSDTPAFTLQPKKKIVAPFTSLYFINEVARPGETALIKVISPFEIDVVDAAEISISLIKSSTLTTTVDVSIAGISTVLVKGSNALRSEIIITNLHATITLRIGDINTTANRGTPLPPYANLILSVTAAIYAYNPDVSAVTLSVLEISD